MVLAIPTVSIGEHRNLMGRTLPLAHQDGARARDRLRRRPPLPARRYRGVFEQPIDLAGPRLRQTAELPLLHGICEAERQQLAAECSWRLFVKYLTPARTQPGARQTIKVLEINI